MELPEQERFTIDDLCERWGKPVSYIVDIAGQLEFRVQLFGHFVAIYPESKEDDVYDHVGYWKQKGNRWTVDFQLTAAEVLQIFRNKSRVLDSVIRTAEGQPDHRQIHFKNFDKSPITITLEHIYIPTRSIYAIEGRSTHRLVIDRLAAHIEKQKGITKTDFGEWVIEKYPSISSTVAQNLFTFLTTPMPGSNILE